MTYIFELLHEKHYFEVLMRKKLDPVGGGDEGERPLRELPKFSMRLNYVGILISAV